jgi:mono/diheme cytochrome c family protein
MVSITSPTPNAKLVKQISISVPVDEVVPEMDTYKGNVDKDQNIDWELKPDVFTIKTEEALNKGKRLFKANCAACHGVAQAGAGPPLAGVTSRRSKEWINRFTRNYNDLVNEGDCEAIEAVNYSPTAMNLFPGLSDEDIAAIFMYVDSTAGPIPPASNCYKECLKYKAIVQKVNSRRAAIEEEFQDKKAVNLEYHDTVLPILPTTILAPAADPPYFVNSTNHRSYYYQIKIDVWGWYNIDALVKDLPGLIKSNLIVEVPGFDESGVTLSLIVPSAKSFSNGGLLQGETSKYVFMYADGSIYLPEGEDVYIVAYGDVKGKFMMATQQFKGSSEHSFVLDMKDAKPDELKSFIARVSNNAAKVKVEKLSAGKDMKKLSEQLDKARAQLPPGCNCECGASQPSASVAPIDPPQSQ